ncbi:hypothetical protein KCP69_11455 [Salmonella enterica subsp. enterica]|nr:hypothetical protein KCP69_11455 [Salmonella enterica subsp. enterica]
MFSRSYDEKHYNAKTNMTWKRRMTGKGGIWRDDCRAVSIVRWRLRQHMGPPVPLSRLPSYPPCSGNDNRLNAQRAA